MKQGTVVAFASSISQTTLLKQLMIEKKEIQSSQCFKLWRTNLGTGMRMGICFAYDVLY